MLVSELFLVLKQTHRGRHTVILCLRLDPAVARLLFSDKNGVLITDFAMIMNLVTLIVCNVTIVDLRLSSRLLRIMSGLHRSLCHQWLFLINMVKVGLFHELLAFRTQLVLNLIR